MATMAEPRSASSPLKTHELSHVLQVAERDRLLRRIEQARIDQLGSQLGVQVAIADLTISSRSGDHQPSSSSTPIKPTLNCIVCSKKFGRIFNRRYCCFVCKMFVCSDCCFVVVRFKQRLCKLCERRRFLKERACEWFYFCLKQRFPYANFGAEWVRQFYASSLCCDAQVQTDDELYLEGSFDSWRLNELWSEMSKNASSNMAIADDEDDDGNASSRPHVMSLRDRCELELIGDLTTLTSEVKQVLKKIDNEEYDAINAIASCYKRRLAWLLSQYQKLFYVVFLLNFSRDNRIRAEQSPCKNCCLDQHANDAYCHHLELAYAARSVIETTSSAIVANCRPAMISPFSDQTISDTVDFERQLADLLIDEAVKQTFIVGGDANKMMTSSKFTRSHSTTTVLTPDMTNCDSTMSYRPSSSQIDEGVHSDLSCFHASGVITGDESLLASTRFGGRMSDCPKVDQTTTSADFSNDQLMMTKANYSSLLEEDDMAGDDESSVQVEPSYILRDEDDDDEQEQRSNNNSSLASNSVDELAFACESPQPQATANPTKTGFNNSTLNLGDYSVRSDSSEFEAMVSRYSGSPRSLMMNRSMMKHQQTPCDDDENGFNRFKFSTPNGVHSPVGAISVNGGERAKFSLTVFSESPISKVTWFNVNNNSDEDQSLVEIRPSAKYSFFVSPARLMKDGIYCVTCEMEIADVGLSDGGKYVCKASNVDGISIAHMMSLTVVATTSDDGEEGSSSARKVVPEFVVMPEATYSAFVGDRLCLQATVKAYPTARIVWLKRGQPFSLSADKRVSVVEITEADSRLVFDGVTTDDEAEYIVVATNTNGECRAVTHIFVREKTSFEDEAVSPAQLRSAQKAARKQSQQVDIQLTEEETESSSSFVVDHQQNNEENQVEAQQAVDSSFSLNETINESRPKPIYQATPYRPRPIRVMESSEVAAADDDEDEMSSSVDKRLEPVVVRQVRSINIKSNVSENAFPSSRGEFDANTRRLSVKELAMLFTKPESEESTAPLTRVASLTYRNRNNSFNYAAQTMPAVKRASVERFESFVGNPYCEDDSAPNSVLRPQRAVSGTTFSGGLLQPDRTSLCDNNSQQREADYSDVLERRRCVIYSHERGFIDH